MPDKRNVEKNQNLRDGDFVEVRLWQDFFDPVRADVFLELRRVGM